MEFTFNDILIGSIFTIVVVLWLWWMDTKDKKEED